MNDYYYISKNSLINLSKQVEELYTVSTFLHNEYNKEIGDNFSKEVLSDGVLFRLNKNHTEINKLINIICNDGKLYEER